MPTTDSLTICEVMAGIEEGGLENHFCDLANGLSRKHTVHVIAHSRYRSLFNDKVIFHPVNLSASRYNPLVLWQLARTIRAINPDVVHAHASKAAAMIGHIRQFLPFPTVVTVHSVKRSTNMYRSFDRVIAVSGGVAKSLQPLVADVIYNGRALTPTSPSLATAQQPVKVLMITRLVEVKRVDVALRAFSNTKDTVLRIAGEGPLRESLEQLAQDLGISDRIEFLGFRRDIPDLINSSDLVLISSDREGFPLAMVESLLLGKPVVSTRVAGAVEFLPDAYLAETGDSEGLAVAITRCVDQPDACFNDFTPVWKSAAEQLTFDAQLAACESTLVAAVNR